jgi:phosphoglycerate dehydrogenase-like enzyme
MPKPTFPPRDRLTVCAAHGAYQLQAVLRQHAPDIACFQVRSRDELKARIAEADVVVVSMLWDNALLQDAARLRFVQSVSAGTDQFDKAAFAARGVRLASAAGVNARAVAEHAMAMLLALKRHIVTGRDNQARRHWRGMISDLAAREAEIGEKTMVLVGTGRIGSAIARRAKAFDMRVIGVRRDPAQGRGEADEIVSFKELSQVLPQADVVVLACPLTPETEGLIDGRALAAMKPTATLINVARGKVVDEAALIAALAEGRLASAGLDVTQVEPLAETSPLWTMPNVLITPHTAGETQAYEANVVAILLDNLDRLWRGETRLQNEIV